MNFDPTIGLWQTRTPGRNDPCPCGSGKKFKKCCGTRETKFTAPQPRTMDAVEAVDRTDAVGNFEQTAVADALVHSGVAPDAVYAFKKTGVFVHDKSRAVTPQNVLARWDAARKEYSDNHTNLSPGVDSVRTAGEGDDAGVRTGDA